MYTFLTDVDKEILLWVQNNLRNEFLTPIFIFFTRLGDMGVIWILIALALLIVRKTRAIGILAFCSLIITLVINNVILKNIIRRIRPYDVIQGLNCLIEKQSDFSFPSGHTACSFAVAVVIFYFLPKKYGVPLLILAFLISFSRLYLGVHYFSDILCGAFIGTFVAIIVCRVGNKIKSFPTKDRLRM